MKPDKTGVIGPGFFDQVPALNPKALERWRQASLSLKPLPALQPPVPNPTSLTREPQSSTSTPSKAAARIEIFIYYRTPNFKILLVNGSCRSACILVRDVGVEFKF